MRKNKNIKLTVLLFFCFTCSRSPEEKSLIGTITSVEQFSHTLHNADSRIVIFDLYTNLCIPCKILSPILKDIAREKTGVVEIYKVNSDSLSQLADYLGATEIPFVVFYKDREMIYAVSGVQSKEEYLQVIYTHSDFPHNQPPTPQRKGVPEAIRVRSSLKPYKSFSDLQPGPLNSILYPRIHEYCKTPWL